MIDIKTIYEDGVMYYVPYKKGLIGWKRIDFKSTDLKEVCRYLDRNGL